nr:hypothetical protein Iba_chr13bCG3650 [Ipomoea batatas]
MKLYVKQSKRSLLPEQQDMFSGYVAVATVIPAKPPLTSKQEKKKVKRDLIQGKILPCSSTGIEKPIESRKRFIAGRNIAVKKPLNTTVTTRHQKHHREEDENPTAVAPLLSQPSLQTRSIAERSVRSKGFWVRKEERCGKDGASQNKEI